MNNIKMYRKRFIPSENILLEKDEVLYRDDNIIVAKWTTINDRNDFDSGYSCYYIKEGYKISEFLKNNKRVYVYCDIIETNINYEENIYTFTDLLADVIVEESGKIRIVDIGEVGECLRDNIITIEQCADALIKLDVLLKNLYINKLEDLLLPIRKYANY